MTDADILAGRARLAQWRQAREAAEQRLLILRDAGLLVYPKWHTHRDGPVHRYYHETGERHAPAGTCRWCGGQDLPARRKLWHPECVEEFKAMRDFADTRYWMIEFASWYHLVKCAICGRDAGRGAELDHERELFDHQDDLTAHFLASLRPLCHDCHAAKTAQMRRARSKRAGNVFSAQPLTPEPKPAILDPEDTTCRTC